MHRAVGNVYSLAVNVCGFVIVTYGLYFINNLVLPEPLAKAGHGQFLTNLSAVLTDVYFAVSIVSHLTASEKLFQFKNFYLFPIALSTEFVVSAVYWGLKFVDEALIATQAVPFILDFTVHISPFVALAVDYFAFMPRVKLPHRSALLLCCSLTGAYWVWLHSIIDTVSGQSFPYPFLNVDTPTRAVIFAGVGTLAFSGFALTRYLHNLLVLDVRKKLV